MSAYIKKSEQYVESRKIFDMLYQEDMAVFLDSSMKNELGRYSIIGICPYLILKEVEGVLYVNEEKKDVSLESFLKEYLKQYKEENDTELPIVSGGIGYFSYDYGRKFEQIKTRHVKQSDIPEVIFVFYDNFIIEDIEKKELYLAANGKRKDKKSSIRQLELLIEEIVNNGEINGEAAKKRDVAIKKDNVPKNDTAGFWKNITLENYASKVGKNFEKKQYIKAIEDVVEYIKKGHIYVMNMTQQFRVKSERAPYQVFQNIQNNNPAPFAAYMNYGNDIIISASPERFLKIRNGIIETRPIKGTRKRGNTKEEDEVLKRELEASEKDKSELLMIVDLERNDLNKICVPGSVQVTELFQVETYATVFHLVANVMGTLRKDIDVVDVLQAVFPGGSVTGAPKVRAMEIIDELEHDRRGIYTGIIGYVSLNGNSEFNIAIRTAVYEKGQYHIGIGGGITYESDTGFEYEETLQKGKALVEAILR